MQIETCIKTQAENTIFVCLHFSYILYRRYCAFVIRTTIDRSNQPVSAILFSCVLLFTLLLLRTQQNEFFLFASM